MFEKVLDLCGGRVKLAAFVVGVGIASAFVLVLFGVPVAIDYFGPIAWQVATAFVVFAIVLTIAYVEVSDKMERISRSRQLKQEAARAKSRVDSYFETQNFKRMNKELM